MARRTAQPRELVRLSPLQFSLSISLVVVMLGGAGLAGYYYGLKQAERIAGKVSSAPAPGEGARSDPQAKGSDADVTFYSALTESRPDPPARRPAKPVKAAVKPVEEKPAVQASPAPDARESVSAGRSLLLQVASCKEQGSAQKLLKELSADGYAGIIVRADLGERGVWFRVRIGPYGEADAKKVLDRLREARGLRGYIVK